MALRRVIQDSDDEDDGGSRDGSPEKAHTIVEPHTSMIQTSSTDPILFRAVYEQHLGPREPQANDVRDNEQSPIFEDSIYDQRMSSSESSARKLKNSKTINASSLTSTSELIASNQKAKCIRSIKDMEDLTQVTTPVESKGASRRDLWEFPSSGASQRGVDASTKVRSRNVSAIPLKTYGRTIRRSHTMAYGASSPPNDYSPGHKTSKRPLEDENGEGLPPMPKSKKHKQDRSMNNGMLHNGVEPSLKPLQIGLLSTSEDIISTSSGGTTVNVPQSPNQASPVGNLTGVTAQVPTLAVSIVQNADPLATSSMVHVFEKSMTPIVIIPNTMTETEKLQYDIVSVPSTAQSRQSSLPEMMDIVDPNLKFTGESSTIPNDTPLPKISSGTVPTPGSVMLLSSSPPVSAVNRKMKRAKSEVASKESPTATVSTSSSKVKKRRQRSKTMALGEKPPHREASVDELSLVPVVIAEVAVRKEENTRNSKTSPRVETELEKPIVNEPTSSDEIGLPVELYKLKPTLRRSKSMFIESSNTIDSSGVEKPTSSRTKSKKFLQHRSPSRTAGAKSVSEVVVPIDVSQRDEEVNTSSIGQMEGEGRSDESRDVIRSEVTTETPKDAAKPPSTPSLPAQPKRRGRKKISEMIPNNQKENLDAQPQETNLPAHKASETESTVLLEADSNKDPLQEPTSTPPPREQHEQPLKITPPKAKTAVDPQPVQTPSKDSKRGPDQHSPLQSGKVPYRVGLSKRMRIAPLLKIIRK